MSDNTGNGDRLLTLAEDESVQGRMNDPTGASFVKGVCGDEMEFYLYIRAGVIEEARYTARGCEVTRACGAWVAKFATARDVLDSMSVNPKRILDDLPAIPAGNRHCAILAVSAFLQAVADYLLKP